MQLVGGPSDGIRDAFDKCTTGDVEYIKHWLDAGGNVNARGDQRQTLLMAWAFSNSKDTSESLGKLLLGIHGIDVNASNNNGDTALHIAATNPDRESFVDLLIEHGATIDCRNNNGETPLHAAMDRYKYDVVVKLIRAGAYIDATTSTGMTPLLILCKRGVKRDINKEIVEYMSIFNFLIDNGAQFTNDILKHTALHTAVLSQNSTGVYLLMDYIEDTKKNKLGPPTNGVIDVSAICVNGYTALHYATQGSDNYIVYLLTKDSNISLTNELKIAENMQKTRKDENKRNNIAKLNDSDIIARLKTIIKDNKKWLNNRNNIANLSDSEINARIKTIIEKNQRK